MGVCLNANICMYAYVALYLAQLVLKKELFSYKYNTKISIFNLQTIFSVLFLLQIKLY